MKSTLKKIILFVLIIVAITVVAVLVFGKKKVQTEELASKSLAPTTTPSDQVDSAKFLKSLSQVKSMNLDTTFFSSKAYQKLIDFSLPIVLEDQRLIGRPNPFAPLGADSVFSQPETPTTPPTIPPTTPEVKKK